MSHCAYLVSFWPPLVRPGPALLPFFFLLLDCLSTQTLGVNLCKRKARKEGIPQHSEARNIKIVKSSEKIGKLSPGQKEAKERLPVFACPNRATLLSSFSLSRNFSFPAVERKMRRLSVRAADLRASFGASFSPRVCCVFVRV